MDNLLRTLVGEHLRSWDLKLFIVEFAYNTYFNRTCRSPYEIVYDFRHRQPIDLIPIADYYRVTEFASTFASHVHELYKEISDWIAQSNTNYKLRSDVRKRLILFNVSVFVMVRIRPEQFPPATFKKLHARSAGPFQILKKLNDNAYVIDLPKIFDISSTFNVDLVDYMGLDFNSNNPLVDEL